MSAPPFRFPEAEAAARDAIFQLNDPLAEMSGEDCDADFGHGPADNVTSDDSNATDDTASVDKDIPLTELGNAQRLVRRYGSRIRFHAEQGQWLIWDSHRFCLDRTGAPQRFAKRIARSFWTIAPKSSNPKACARHAIQSEKNSAIEAMLNLAATEAGIGVTSAQLDADPFLLNVLNGTIDLRTGRLRKHRQDDLLTKLAPVEYRPDCPTPLWDQFLNRIMDSNAGMITYLARLAGLCLTGAVTEQELYIPWGQGANGKNVYFDTIAGMMGDYAGPAPASLLTETTHDRHPTEIADLLGSRLVVASELDESARLRVALIKRLTGDLTLKARFMRQNFFTFTRTHKLVIVTNSKPLIRENTHAIWRRVRLIPFTVTIPADERDPPLTEKLKKEWSGILAWAVRGCIDWQQHGMNAPPEVISASASYQAEQDVLADFLADWLKLDAHARVTRNDVFGAYQSYAKQAGENHPLDRTALFERLRRLDGITEGEWRPVGSNVASRGFKGLGLISQNESGAE